MAFKKNNFFAPGPLLKIEKTGNFLGKNVKKKKQTGQYPPLPFGFPRKLFRKKKKNEKKNGKVFKKLSRPPFFSVKKKIKLFWGVFLEKLFF